MSGALLGSPRRRRCGSRVSRTGEWTNVHGPEERSGSIALEAGHSHAIRLEYLEFNQGAGVRLEWTSASQAREVIPGTSFDPAPLGP